MKHLILAVVVIFSGCTSVERESGRTRDQLELAKVKAELQSVELQMCVDRANHSSKCAAQCRISKVWHKKRWKKN
jgi:hypothetical protein